MTSTAERDERGRFSPEHPDEEVLAAVREHNPAATSEVAEELGIARQSADSRLRKLADGERVRQKKIAAVAVWTPIEDGEGDT